MLHRSMKPAILPLLLLGACTPETSHHATGYVQSLLEARRDDMIVQKWDLSCGAAALATLLTYDLGQPVTEHEVAATLLRRYRNIGQVQQQLGFSLLDLKSFAVDRGLSAAGYGDMDLHDLAEAGPSILPVHINGFNHFVVFRGFHGNRVLLADPAFGNRTMQLDYFMEIWRSRMAFVVSLPGGAKPGDGLAPRPEDFWATSIGSEPVPPRIMALEAEAAGTALVAAASPMPDGEEPVVARMIAWFAGRGAPSRDAVQIAAVPLPPPATVAQLQDAAVPLAGVIAGGAPRDHEPDRDQPAADGQ